MKKLLFVISVAASIAVGNVLARLMFGPINPAVGGDEITACAILVWAILYLVYELVKRPFREAAAVRLARYTARRDAKFREIEAKRFMMRYEALRRDFLEGRGVQC